MEVKVKVLKKGCAPEQHGDWIDLKAATTITLLQGTLARIPLGVAVELPDGCEAIVAARSSLPFRRGVIAAGGIGVIDNDYCGDSDEWKLAVYAIRDTTIPQGERVCQFRIQQNQPPVKFTEVESLGNENRGGFGSTGA